MASSSTSSVQKDFKYDVFLSFRGEDTRKNFVDHLYYALQQKSIHTYKDDERIEKGKTISDELMKSIQDSRFYIIVFSERYASSSWCLDELVKIMECQKMTEHTAYPVFYDVEPTEVRKQSGEFGKAFVDRGKEEGAQEWRAALKEAANMAGWELKTTVDGHEAKFIQKIVEEISIELRSIDFSVDGKLIGMETRIMDVVSSLEMGFDDFRMIGIKGIGGGGKTTLARAVFDQISFQFEGSSFVENVREASKSPMFGLKSLQKQVLSDVLNNPGITVSSVHDGKKMMKKMMCCRKVFVVLDDVDHIEQLEALAGQPNWFKKGSRIIITTRDEQVLVAHNVKLIHDVNLLSNEEAICLFSRYAFGREIPIQGYKELSGQVVGYAAGLPLTIKVLGSFLCGKDEIEWKDALDRLKTIPLKETLEILELSYIGLEEDYKEIFLDVACMLIGLRKEQAIRVLESCGFHGRNGLRVLEQKSLITISEDESLGMHDHIREMGRNIVRRLHPDEPNKHSRLWIDEEIEDILTNGLGTEATRSISLATWDLKPEIVIKGLENMTKLRYLYVFFMRDGDSFHSDWKCDEVSLYFPDALRCLSWNCYPFGTSPKTFHVRNLVSVSLYDSGIVQLWDGGERKAFNKLRFLYLTEIKLKTLDLGLTPNLETLTLFECPDLLELLLPHGCLKLKFLKLEHTNLRTLNLVWTPNLEELYLLECHDLVELHIPVGCLKLICLDLNCSKLRIVDLRGTPNLETLSLRGCYDLVELHIPVECLRLKSLNLSSSMLRTLDLRGARNLETLSVAECVDLVKLHIHVECLKLEFIGIMGAKLRTFDLGWTPNLKTLSVTECYHLVEVHAHDWCLKMLEYIDLSGCLRFKSFLFRKQSELVEVGCVSKLHLKAESLEMCPLHFRNNLPNFRFACFYEEHGPSIGNIEKLISFGLCACTNLEHFSQSICGLRCLTKLTLEGGIPESPKDLDRLECLEELNLLSTKITRLPDSICKLKHLKCLKLDRCCFLEKLPEDLGRLECLEKLILSECVFLRHIPDNIYMMKRLQYFLLPGCIAVEKLPEGIGCLKCLKELNIEGTNIRQLPESIFELNIEGTSIRESLFELKGLRIVGYRWLLQLYGFTSEIQTSEDETFCYVEL